MKRHLVIISLITMGLMGCSKKEGTETPAAAPTVVTPATPTTPPPPTTPTTPQGTRGASEGSNGNWYWKSGGQAVFTYDNFRTFEDYTGRPMNSPSEIRINVDLKDVGNGAFGGTIKIGYYDTDTTYTQKYFEGVFDSGTSTKDTQYNKWVMVGNQLMYQGFYEDRQGALILVIDGRDDNDLLKGAVYFKNFNWPICTKDKPYDCGEKPATKCWFISLGPYNCQDFLVGKNIVMGSRSYPDPANYTRLGRFEGLDIKKSFNQ